MACNSCSPNDSSPPGGFRPSGQTSGGQSSFAGNSVIATNCVQACPQPPTSSQIGRVPYCPPWVASLYGSFVGKLIIQVGGNCLNYLRSGASGWVRYDATTESVVIDNAPPFASSTPRGANFGYAALAIPTVTPVYNESLGACQNVVTQEIGSQTLSQRSDGRILLGNIPVTGDVPCPQSDDMQNQMRFDYLVPQEQADLESVSPLIKMLASFPGSRVAGGQTLVTEEHEWMTNLTFRRSQIVQAPATAYPQALTALWVPVPGGTTEDPAFTLRIGVTAPTGSGTLPADPNQGDTVIWNGAPGVNNPNLPANSWVAFPRGLGTFLFPSPVTLVAGRTTAGTLNVTLPALPAVNSNGPIGIIIYSKTTAGSSTTFKASFGARTLGYTNGSTGGDISYGEVTIYYAPSPFTLTMAVDFAKIGSGSVSCDLSVVGYLL